MYNLNKAFSFHIELTDKCNARCVQCERNEILKDGTLRENPKLLQTEISIDQFKAIFENYHKQARYIVFCGNYGDPMFAKDILEITEHCITKVLSPTKEFGTKWIPCELIFPTFKIGESVKVSSVYPLVADPGTTRVPVMKQQIAGLSGRPTNSFGRSTSPGLGALTPRPIVWARNLGLLGGKR